MEKKKYAKPGLKVQEIEIESIMTQSATGGQSGTGGFGAKSNDNSVEPEASSSWVNNDESN